MEKTDARKLSLENKYDLRKSTIRICKKGKGNQLAAETARISVPRITRIWRRY
jgi:hypothetical protein